MKPAGIVGIILIIIGVIGFAWGGLGYWLFQAVLEKDFPVMQAMFYLIALTVIAANFIADVLYGIVDPRIRYE